MSEGRRIWVEFRIEDWRQDAESLERAIDEFAEFYGVTLTCIGMSGDLTGRVPLVSPVPLRDLHDPAVQEELHAKAAADARASYERVMRRPSLESRRKFEAWRRLPEEEQ